MKNILKGMMLSCEKATILVEKKLDLGLTLSERLQLRFHTSMCDACTNYQKQSLLIHELLKKQIPFSETHNCMRLSGSKYLKNEMLKRLKL
jgi:hypothetical protein